MNISEIREYFLSHDFSTYERDNYDSFIKSQKFSFPIKSIHITGTNGKGSVAKYLTNIYQSEGYKVGLYNSPFLSDVTEMISINNKNISSEEYASLFNEFYKEFEKYHLSSFEIQTYIAYIYFLRNNVDLAIIEVGMGGYIDATNIITPILSIITSVSLEHTSYLGRSVSEIAANKAGIIKNDVPSLVGKLDESAMYAIKERTEDVNSKLYVVNDYYSERVENNHLIFDYYPYLNVELNTLSEYQLKNASIAIEATRILSNEIKVSEESIRKGLLMDLLPCRYEYINEHILIDGGHNPEAIGELVKSLTKSNDKPIHVIFAAFKDKNIEQMLVKLSSISEDISLTTFPHKRARTEEDYFLYLGDYSFSEDYKSLINSKISEFPDDLILITGSLAFAGLVREFLKGK